MWGIRTLLLREGWIWAGMGWLEECKEKEEGRDEEEAYKGYG
jgi:hypothetical protein